MRQVAGHVVAILAALAALAPGAWADATKRPLVVIDPGHGGSNTGTRGPEARTLEKELTLSYARELEKELQKSGVRVLLTRDKDVFLTLRERSRLANRVGADVFLSLHFNASPHRNRRGFETFLLPPRAIRADAPALRGHEPPTARAGAPALSTMLDDVQRGLSQEPSFQLASLVQTRLATARGRSPNRGVKQDAMHVLLGATMPAVLVEIGFLDHPVEGPTLVQDNTRRAVCRALAAAVIDFVSQRTP